MLLGIKYTLEGRFPCTVSLLFPNIHSEMLQLRFFFDFSALVVLTIKVSRPLERREAQIRLGLSVQRSLLR